MVRGAPNISLAVAAARAWVHALSIGSECAITMFDHKAALLTDFVRDTSKLFDAIASLKPRGGTDYDAGMLTPYIGGIPIASTGRSKRVLIFLTDGNGNGNAQQMISEARSYGITVYCVSLGMAMPDALRLVSEETGGIWFENVTTVEQAEMAYRRIHADAIAPQMCTIEIQIPPTCSSNHLVSVKIGSNVQSRVVTIPESNKLTPSISNLSLRVKNSSDVQKFWIRAGQLPLILTGVDISSVNTTRVLQEDKVASFPLTIPAEDSLEFMLSMDVVDTLYNISRIQFSSTPCPLPAIYASSGQLFTRTSKRTIHVSYPNGTERIPASSLTHLAYDGVPHDVPVRLEVSTDLGRTWTMAHEKATSHNAPWRALSISSDSCLLRVSQVIPDELRMKPIAVVQGVRIEQVEYHDDGTRLITSALFSSPSRSGVDSVVRIHDAVTGKTMYTFPGIRFAVVNGGRSICTWGLSGPLDCYDLSTGSLRWRTEITPSSKLISFFPDRTGSVALVIGALENDRPRTISCETGLLLATFPNTTKDLQSASISPNGAMVSFCGKDSSISVYDASSAAFRHRLRTTPPTQPMVAAFSPNNTRIVATSRMGLAQVWNTADGMMLKSVAKRQYVNDNAYVVFLPDGARVLLETGKDQTSIVDIETGESLVTMQRSQEVGGVVSAVVSKDGALVALSSLGRLTIHETSSGVMIYEIRQADYQPSLSPDASRLFIRTSETDAGVYDIIPPILQADTSDARWTIFRTDARLRDVRFGPRIAGLAVDSLIRFGLVNGGTDTITLNSIRIEGADAKQFAVRTQPGITLLPGDSTDIEYSFTPTKPGERAALIVADVSGGSIKARISGQCIGSLLSAEADFLDFGVLDVGESRDYAADDLLTNNGKAQVHVRNIRKVGQDSGSFEITSPTEFMIDPNAFGEVFIRFTATEEGRLSTRLAFDIDGYSDPLYATLYGMGMIDTFRVALLDPTTFRGIILPTAIVPAKGTITTAIYDVVGLVAGYSITNNIMVIAGGVPPITNQWIGASEADAAWNSAWSLGAKVGFAVAPDIVVGGGYQIGESYYNKNATSGLDSKITFNALWTSVGWGNDDSRLNLTLGYAIKVHNTIGEGRFNANAAIYGIGYDKRISYHWKLCGELLFMRTMTFVPLTFTARYFDAVQAFDIGFTITGIPASGSSALAWPVVPMISWVRRW